MSTSGKRKAEVRGARETETDHLFCFVVTSHGVAYRSHVRNSQAPVVRVALLHILHLWRHKKHHGAFFRHALDGAVLWVREGGRDGGREGRRERPGEREGLAELQGRAGKRDRLVAWKIQNNRVR